MTQNRKPKSKPKAHKKKVTRNEIGQLHSYDDKPAIIRADGTQQWYKDGQQHREGAPARISGTTQMVWWMQDGQVHRTDGPACTGFGASPYRWWIMGEPYNNAKAWQEAAGISDEEMLAVILKHGAVGGSYI